MIYWNNYDSYRIIRDDSLNTMAEEQNVVLIPTRLNEEMDEWFNFAHIMASKYNFNFVYETCFEYYITLYFTDEGLSAGAEEEYFYKKLDKRIADLYMNAKLNGSEREQKIQFFNDLVELFKSDEIKQYEKKIFQHNIKVNDDVREWFSQFKTIREGILQLMEGNVEKPKLDVYSGNQTSILFMLTYSENKEWMELSPINDRDRLRVLLF